MKIVKSTKSFDRDSWGKLTLSNLATEPDIASFKKAESLALMAAKSSKIDTEADHMEWAKNGKGKTGCAVRHEIIDFSNGGNRAVVRVRDVEAGYRRGESFITTIDINYFLIQKQGRGVSVAELECQKMICVRTVKKHGSQVGHLIARLDDMELQ